MSNHNTKMLALPLLAVTLLTACNTNKGSSSSFTPGATSDLTGTTVNFMVYQPSDQDDQNALKELLAEFTEETGINVRLQATVKDKYDSTFKSAISRGNFKPDLAYMDQPLIATYASAGSIIQLDEYIDYYEIDTSVYNQAAYGTNVYNKHTYGLPLNITASVLLYNKDLVSEEEVPNSLDEWVNVETDSGVALFEGVGSGGYAGWYFQSFLENCGGKLYDEATNTVAFNSAEGIKAATYIRDLYRMDTNDDTIRTSANAFANGSIAFKIGSSYDIDNLFKQKPNFNLGVALMPGNGTTHYSVMGGENLVIPSTAANKDGAMMLLKFLNEKDNMELLGSFTGNFPSITEYQETESPYMQVVLEQLNHVVSRPIVPGWMTVNDQYLGQAISDIVNPDEKRDITEALTWAEAASNQALKKAA